MNKGNVLAAFIVLFLFQFSFQIAPVFAKAEPKLDSLFAPTPSKKDEEARAALRKKVLEKKAELNGSSWEIQIDSQAKKGDLLGKDTLVFQNEKFRSEKAGKLDYGSTNYTLTVQEEGPTIWETMQTSKDGEVTFWRGEWKDDTMTGVISRQLKESNEDYYFTSAGRKEIPKATEEPKEEVAPVAAAAAEEKPNVLVTPEKKTTPVTAPSTKTAATAKTAKKSSWFM